MTRQREEQAHDEQLGIAAARARCEQIGLVAEIGELEEQLGGIMAIGVEGEGLGEDALEAPAAIALEAHLAGVERVGEAEDEGPPQRLDCLVDAAAKAPRLPPRLLLGLQRLVALTLDPPHVLGRRRQPLRPQALHLRLRPLRPPDGGAGVARPVGLELVDGLPALAQ